MTWVRPAAFTAFAAFMLSATPVNAECVPDVIVVNARIHTVDPARPAAEAVAVCGDVISNVGSTADITRLAGPRTRVPP